MLALMDRPILLFRSAQPGFSFETWLFQRLTPRSRRLLTAAIAAYGPAWRTGSTIPGGLRRRGPALLESRVRLGRPAARPTPGSPAKRRTRVWTVSIFFLQADTGPVVLSAGADRVRDSGEVTNRGLGRARYLLRELRELERQGVLSRRLSLYTFEEIKHQSRVGRTIAWDKERSAGLIALDDVRRLVLEEAEAEGRGATSELHAAEERYRIGRRLALRRAECRLTQSDVAACTGVRQAIISEIESGLANPTLSTLSAVAHALDCGLDLVGLDRRDHAQW